VAYEQPRFTPPILIQETAVRELCRLARNGYEHSGKRETFGFLYGVIDSDNRLVVRSARYYRGGTKTRYGITLPVRQARRRRRELARELKLRFLGSFHSHVEVGGHVSRGLSDDDRSTFRQDEEALLELVVFVWAGRRKTLRPTPRSVVAYEPDTGYHYRVRVYAKLSGGIRKTRIKVIRSGVVIVY